MSSMIGLRTSRYEFAYGKKPRGFGNWAFEIAGAVYFWNGKYSECKKNALAQAKEIAKQNNMTYVLVNVES